MDKITRIIHIALTVIAWGIFVSSLIRFAAVWDSLPDRIGIHFDSDGGFDVIGSKNDAAYPYIVSIIALVSCEGLALLSKKIKMGMKISEKGDAKIRTALVLLLDISKLGFSFFFSGVWADCVISQRPLDTGIPAAIVLIMLLSFLAFVIAAVVIKIKCPPEGER